MPDSWASSSLPVVSPRPVHVTIQCSLSRRGARPLTRRLQFSKKYKNGSCQASEAQARAGSAACCWLNRASGREGGASARCGRGSVGQSPPLALSASCPSYPRPCKPHPNVAAKAGTSSPKSGAGREGHLGDRAPYALAQVQRPVEMTVNLLHSLHM